MKTESQACRDGRIVHTIGHSTRDIDSFLRLLDSHDIAHLVDVRRWPSSRRFPHFDKDPLARSLEEHGIAYSWVEALGGYRRPEPDSPNTAWRVGGFRGYADYMLTDEFRVVLGSLESAAQMHRIALMCAEAHPSRCHRRILSDAFVVRGWWVQHIVDDGCKSHSLPPFADVEGDRIFYRSSATLL